MDIVSWLGVKAEKTDKVLCEILGREGEPLLWALPFFSLNDLFISFLCFYMCAYVYVCSPRVCRCPQRQEVVGSPRTGGTGGVSCPWLRTEPWSSAIAAPALDSEPSNS